MSAYGVVLQGLLETHGGALVGEGVVRDPLSRDVLKSRALGCRYLVVVTQGGVGLVITGVSLYRLNPA